MHSISYVHIFDAYLLHILCVCTIIIEKNYASFLENQLVLWHCYLWVQFCTLCHEHKYVINDTTVRFLRTLGSVQWLKQCNGTAMLHFRTLWLKFFLTLNIFLLSADNTVVFRGRFVVVTIYTRVCIYIYIHTHTHTHSAVSFALRFGFGPLNMSDRKSKWL